MNKMSTSKPKQLDIFIPAYGGLDYLEKAIESVFTQTYQNWRLVIVDDNYPGNETKKMVAKYAKKTKNEVKYIKNKTNLGFAKNFQNCLQYTKNDWCIIMGADDSMKSKYLEKFIKIEKNVDFDFYQPTIEVIDKDGKMYLPLGDKIKAFLRPKKSGVYYGDKTLARLMTGNYFYFPSIIWKTKTIKKYGFTDKFGTLTDIELESKILLNNGGFYLDNATPTFQYRRHQSASTKNRQSGKFQQEEKIFYNWIIETAKKKSFSRTVRSAKLRITSRIATLFN